MNKKFYISQTFSLNLSLAITKILFIVLIIFSIIAPFIAKYYNNRQIIVSNVDSLFVPVLILMYLAIIIAFPALFLLHKLLINVRKNEVFTKKTVWILRIISYLCFAEGIVFFVFGFCRPVSFVISGAAIFFGIIMRVLKNVFAAAAYIKEENDLTV